MKNRSFVLVAIILTVSVGFVMAQEDKTIMIEATVDGMTVQVPVAASMITVQKNLVIKREQRSDNFPLVRVRSTSHGWLAGIFGTCEVKSKTVCLPSNCIVDYESTGGKGYEVVTREGGWNYFEESHKIDGNCLVSSVKVCKTGLGGAGGKYNKHHVIYGKCAYFE